MTVSFIVASVGRPTLADTLDSITSQWLPGDQVLVVSASDEARRMAIERECTFVPVQAPGYDWGATEKALGMKHAACDYVAFMDDDDTYAPDARKVMARAMAAHPGQPLMFRMRYQHDHSALWNNRTIAESNVASPMLVAPNQPEMLGTWGRRYGNDFDYIKSMRWPHESVVWIKHVIALIGDGAGQRYRRVSVLVQAHSRAYVQRLLRSFHETVRVPESAELVFRVLADDHGTLALLQDETPWNIVLGPPVTPAHAYAELAAVAKGELLLCGDDAMRLVTPDWSMRALYEASKYRDGVFRFDVDGFTALSRHAVTRDGYSHAMAEEALQ